MFTVSSLHHRWGKQHCNLITMAALKLAIKLFEPRVSQASSIYSNRNLPILFYIYANIMPHPEDNEHGRHDKAGNENGWLVFSPVCCGNGAQDTLEVVVEYFPSNSILLRPTYDMHVSSRGAKVSHKVHHSGAGEIYD